MCVLNLITCLRVVCLTNSWILWDHNW